MIPISKVPPSRCACGFVLVYAVYSSANSDAPHVTEFLSNFGKREAWIRKGRKILRKKMPMRDQSFVQQLIVSGRSLCDSATVLQHQRHPLLLPSQAQHPFPAKIVWGLIHLSYDRIGDCGRQWKHTLIRILRVVHLGGLVTSVGGSARNQVAAASH